MLYDSIPIPSEGIFYKGRPEYLKIFYMTTEDELQLCTLNAFAKGDALITLLKKTVCEPNELPYEDLLLHDRDYLLLWLKDNAFGYVLDYADKKSSVYFNSQDIDIKMGVPRLPDDGLIYTYKQNGIIFKIRHLKAIDIPKLNKKKSLTYYILHVVSINGNDNHKYIEHQINNMPIAEAKKLKKFIDSIAFGVNKKTHAVLDGKRQEIELEIDESLFGLTLQNLGKLAKNLNDAVFFLLNEGNGYTEQGVLKMPTHIRKLHEDKLIQKINKINENMKNNK